MSDIEGVAIVRVVHPAGTIGKGEVFSVECWASIGRSCIRFKKLADVDLRVLARIVKENEAAAQKLRKLLAKST